MGILNYKLFNLLIFCDEGDSKQPSTLHTLHLYELIELKSKSQPSTFKTTLHPLNQMNRLFVL